MGIVELRDVTVEFGTVKALDSINVDIHAGEMFSVIGPNGAGKTTALRVIAGLLNPSAGEVYFHGELMEKSNRHALRRQAPMVFQKPVLFNTTLFKNVAYGLRIRGMAEEEIRKRVLEVLEMVQLANLQDRLGRNLSGGEQRRATLAMAIVLDTELLLVDEPTAYLDSESAEIVESTLQRLNSERGTTTVMVTHNILQAQVLANRAAMMKQGRIQKIGTVSEIFRTELDSLLHEEFKMNTYSGTAKASGKMTQNGMLVQIDLGNGVEIEALSKREGNVTVMIPPDDIIVSREEVFTSARNCLIGKIIGIDERDSTVFLTVDVGLSMTVQITRRSREKLDINLKDEVYVTFKASSVRVF
ncbi:MAG: ABC transporter ATP-binding protein [Candidatus Thorarchaeota archaeon]|nr:ABC transporter ATP-binding protein [Candidatus Thorarchaeota archaeon]